MTGRIIAVVGLAREARIIAGPDVVTVIGGGQSARLARRLQDAAAEGAAGVLSFGLCGALAPGLRVGDCVVAEGIVADGGTLPTDADWSAAIAGRLEGVTRGLIAGGSAVVASAADKAELNRLTGAVAVDMESHIAARLAAEREIPFAAVRVVSDAAERSLPPAAVAGFRTDGGIDVWGVIAALAKAPGDLPALVRTGLDAERAFAALNALARARVAGADPGQGLGAGSILRPQPRG